MEATWKERGEAAHGPATATRNARASPEATRRARAVAPHAAAEPWRPNDGGVRHDLGPRPRRHQHSTSSQRRLSNTSRPCGAHRSANPKPRSCRLHMRNPGCRAERCLATSGEHVRSLKHTTARARSRAPPTIAAQFSRPPTPNGTCQTLRRIAMTTAHRWAATVCKSDASRRQLFLFLKRRPKPPTPASRRSHLGVPESK